MIRLSRKIAGDARGAAVIELALIAPILATFAIGIVDISGAFSRKLELEQAAQRGIEKVMQTTVDATVDETIVDEAAAAAGVEEDQVALEYWLECASVRMGSYAEDCVDGESEARYIVLTVNDKYTPFFPLRIAGLNGDGTYHLSATSGIRTR